MSNTKTKTKTNNGANIGGIAAIALLGIGVYFLWNNGTFEDIIQGFSGGSSAAETSSTIGTGSSGGSLPYWVGNAGAGYDAVAAVNPTYTGGLSAAAAAAETATKKEVATVLNSIYGTNGGVFTGNYTEMNTQTDGAKQWKLETTTGYDVYLTGGSGNLADYVNADGTLRTQASINAAGLASKKEAASTTYEYVASNDGRYFTQKGAQDLANTNEWTANKNDAGQVTSLTKKETGASRSSGSRYVTSTGGIDSGGSGKRTVKYSDGSTGTIDN